MGSTAAKIPSGNPKGHFRWFPKAAQFSTSERGKAPSLHLSQSRNEKEGKRTPTAGAHSVVHSGRLPMDHLLSSEGQPVDHVQLLLGPSGRAEEALVEISLSPPPFSSPPAPLLTCCFWPFKPDRVKQCTWVPRTAILSLSDKSPK